MSPRVPRLCDTAPSASIAARSSLLASRCATVSSRSPPISERPCAAMALSIEEARLVTDDRPAMRVELERRTLVLACLGLALGLTLGRQPINLLFVIPIAVFMIPLAPAIIARLSIRAEHATFA